MDLFLSLLQEPNLLIELGKYGTTTVLAVTLLTGIWQAPKIIKIIRNGQPVQQSQPPMSMLLEVSRQHDAQAERRHGQVVQILDKIADSNAAVHRDIVRVLERLG